MVCRHHRDTTMKVMEGMIMEARVMRIDLKSENFNHKLGYSLVGGNYGRGGGGGFNKGGSYG
jgi:hypothetical protein